MSEPFLKKYLSNEKAGMLFGHLVAVLLGIVSASITLLVGPALQLLLSDRAKEVAWRDLVSPRLSWVPEVLTGASTVSGSQLFQLLPPLLIGVAAVKTALSAMQWFTWERLSERMARDIRQDLMAAYVYLRPSARRTPRGLEVDGSMATAVTNDVRLVREYVVHFYGGLPREGMQVVFLGVTLILLSPKLFLLFALGLAPAAAFLRRLGKRLGGRTSKVLSDTSELAEWIQQRFLGIETIKQFRTEELELQKLQMMNAGLLDRMKRAARLRARTSPLIEAFAVVAIVAILFVALRDIRSGATSGAVLVSFFSSIGLFGQAAAKLGKYFNSNKEGLTAVRRLASIHDFLSGNSVDRAGARFDSNLITSKVAVRCDGLRVEYSSAHYAALDNFSYDFRPARVYAIGGASGAGKTTLFKAILGLVEPSNGSVSLAGPVCYMPQDVRLMSTSLLENIGYPASVPDRMRAEKALTAVGLGDFTGRLDVGVEGFSGGQAQRVLLARLLYHDTPVVLVDEGTSALDPEVEKTVYACLHNMAARGACVIMIAHRIPALESADEILILEGGRLVQQGTAAIVRQSPAFSKLISQDALL
jgi:ABC-type multidrug transport system fused ATPase/permease subunit